MNAWDVFLGAALWFVAFAGFWAFVTHRTRGGLNWGGPPVRKPKPDSGSERAWRDASGEFIRRREREYSA